MDKDATYAEDVFVWSQRQAALLRDLARSRGALPNELDLPNIAEEIEGVGLSELNSVLSHLEEMLIHAIKAASRPDAEPYRHWLNEIDAHQRNALRRCTPGMRQLIDIAALWKGAVRSARTSLARFDEAMADMPADAPVTLDELLDPAFSAEDLLARLPRPRP